MNPLRILYLSAEIAPFAKTGGLGDVGGSLPKALQALGHDVLAVMPAYQPIEAAAALGRYEVLPPIQVQMGFGTLQAGVFRAHLPGSKVPIYFIAESSLFNRSGYYGYGDDGYRFAFFSRAALELTRSMGWRPDIIHAHDWHTAPAVTWLATAGQVQDWFRGIPSLYTIHNLMHQGHTDWGVFDYLGIISHRLGEEGYNEVNWMARGIFHATLINTVSPTYAREILTREGGSGMDSILNLRSYDVHGILNGIDYDEWDPLTDKTLPRNFGADSLEQRLENKRRLQQRAGLPERADLPLIAMVTRLDHQKGLDITGHVLHMLMNNYGGDAQFVVLGTGNPRYHQMLEHLSGYHRQKMTAFLFYDSDLSHLIYAGADLFLMPSLFEPCGLGQMIAMRYGNIPVVRATGGLADTVQDGVTGFTFNEYNSEAFWQALARGMYVFRSDRQAWQTIQRNAMNTDFTWRRSALGYQQLFGWAIARAKWNAAERTG